MTYVYNKAQYIKLLLSTQTGSGLTPVGGIIVWPKDSDPSTSSNIWLECNGQTFDTRRFPKLYKVLGSNRVPNYQGMFLRGAGSQNFSQNNGVITGSNTTYASGNVGEIQGDSARLFLGSTGNRPLMISDSSYRAVNTSLYPEWYINSDTGNHTSGWGTMKRDDYGSPSRPFSIFLYTSPKHYKYSLSCSGGKDSHSCSLSEHTSSVESDEGTYLPIFASNIGMDTRFMWPTANEFRPVNIAVKYYIRAK